MYANSITFIYIFYIRIPEPQINTSTSESASNPRKRLPRRKVITACTETKNRDEDNGRNNDISNEVDAKKADNSKT